MSVASDGAQFEFGAKDDGTAFEERLQEELPRGYDTADMTSGERTLAARWLRADEMVGDAWQAGGGLLLGYRGGRVIGWKDNRHLLTIAGSRAGKGASLVIPNLIFYPGSAVVVDPKGENAARTAGQRGKGSVGGRPGLGQDVYVLDPFGESGLDASLLAKFNPFEKMTKKTPDLADEVGLFAEALITHPESGERYWTESAQAVLRALILMVVLDIPRFGDRRNLVTVRNLLMLTDPAIETLIQARKDATPEQSDEPNSEDSINGRKSTKNSKPKEVTSEEALLGLLADMGAHELGHICVGVSQQLQSMSDRERGSVLSTARTQTQWLDSPKMLGVLKSSTEGFDLENLKRKRMTVYLCLPASRMVTHARWLRLMILLSIGVMERVKVKPEHPVLFVLDEFPVLGYMQSIETAAGLMAGFDVKLWPIVQNVGQLKQHYPRSWETFLANAGMVMAFAAGDAETLKVLSDWLGRRSILVGSESYSTQEAQMKGALQQSRQPNEVALLAEHEIRTIFARARNRAIVFNVESYPGIVERFTYHSPDDRLFVGRFDP